MQIKFKKLIPAAKAPKQGTPGSAGFDLTAITREYDENNQVWEYSTGIAVEIPKGFVGLIFPRSSVFRTGVILSNCCGVIDSDYRGDVKVKFYSLWELQVPYQIGERVCQLVIVPTPEVEYIQSEELSPTSRGTGGYGSTGK